MPSRVGSETGRIDASLDEIERNTRHHRGVDVRVFRDAESIPRPRDCEEKSSSLRVDKSSHR